MHACCMLSGPRYETYYSAQPAHTVGGQTWWQKWVLFVNYIFYWFLTTTTRIWLVLFFFIVKLQLWLLFQIKVLCFFVRFTNYSSVRTPISGISSTVFSVSILSLSSLPWALIQLLLELFRVSILFSMETMWKILLLQN